MVVVEFVVWGDPVGKKAPYVYYNKKKKKHSSFTPKKARDYESYIALVANQHKPIAPLDEPLAIEIIYYIPRPKSRASNKHKYPDRKPDIDNLDKLVVDSMEGIIFVNDSRIVMKKSMKLYGDPRVEIKILTLDETSI